MLQIRKATRTKSKLRLAIIGPSGAGKTKSALLIAKGLGDKILLIDTENGSGDLYSDMFEYDIVTLTPPFEIQYYVEAIKAAEEGGYDVVILDSITHAWSGQGGLLERVDKIASASSSKNSYTAWRDVTPQHNAFIDAIVQSSVHVIATMRSKTEYVMEDDGKGRKVPRKVGMAPIQRDGMEYEFTVVFDINDKHLAFATKDRTGMFDGQIFMPDSKTGTTLKGWLDSGADAPVEPTLDRSQMVIEAMEAINECQSIGELLELWKTQAELHDDVQYQAALQSRKNKLIELEAKAKEEAQAAALEVNDTSESKAQNVVNKFDELAKGKNKGKVKPASEL